MDGLVSKREEDKYAQEAPQSYELPRVKVGNN